MFRLPADTAPARVRLQVADIDRSLAFYLDVLGLRVLERSATRAFLGPAGSGDALVELHARAGAAPVPRRGRLGLFHFAILLPDRAALGAFVRHLSDSGVPAGASDHLVSEALYLTDPDGLGIEVYADRPRSEWRRRDGELVMSTEPLDLADLVRAAAGAPWSGIPAGTTLGHIHLHVGDLRQAAAFYGDALGLDTMVSSYPGALFLSAGGYHHHLGLNTWAAGAQPARADEARLLEWELHVPTSQDVQDVIASMQSAGHDPLEDATTGSALIRDPWGTALRIRPAETPRP